MTENESGNTIELARMVHLVNRARGVMNLLLITSVVVFWGNWDTGPTRLASMRYAGLISLSEKTADFTPEEDFRGLLLPEARKAANKALAAAAAARKKAEISGDWETARRLIDASKTFRDSKNRMDESQEQQLTVSAFQSQPLEILGFYVHPERAVGLLSIMASGLLLYLICLAHTMRRYPIVGSDWIFHLDGMLPVILGGCWLLLPAVAITMANGQLLWEILISRIFLTDSSYLFLMTQYFAGILAPLLLGGLATWLAWKTRGNPSVIRR